MKNQTATVAAGVLAILLLFGGSHGEPVNDDPPATALADQVGDPVQVPRDVPVPTIPSLSSESEPAVVADERPELRMYSGDSCIICEQLLREIEAIGGLNALPFRMVECKPLPWMKTVPWFYWEDDDSASGWMRLQGCGTRNGKRLDYLITEWLSTQPSKPAGVNDATPGPNATICCCAKGGGMDTAACLCIDEIRAGVERGHCTCTAEYGSRHHSTESGTVPAGGYRQFGP